MNEKNDKLIIRRPPPKNKVTFFRGGTQSKLNEVPLDQVRMLLNKGFSEKEVCEFFKFTDQMWKDWKIKNNWLTSFVEDWKAEYDTRIERALAERAEGYKHKEEKVFCYNGQIVTHEVMKQYPPDVQAATLWLTNRKPTEWKRQEYTAKVQAGIQVNIERPKLVDLNDFTDAELKLIAQAGKKLNMQSDEIDNTENETLKYGGKVGRPWSEDEELTAEQIKLLEQKRKITPNYYEKIKESTLEE